MNLTFDSISDLQEFLHWADKYRAVDLTVNRAREPIGAALTGAAQWPKTDTAGVAFDTPQSALNDADRQAIATAMVVAGTLPADLAKQADAEKSPEQPATRKRRTKAEIAADEKAAADLAATKAQGEGTTKAADTPAGSETAPTGTNPFDATPAAADTPAAAAEEPADTTVTPFKHLTRAREFIAKHGMPKYNETFAKAELDTNVMGYTAEQRALHLAAMDALEQA